MRVIVIFFLCLCFQLLGGYDYAHASAPNHGKTYLPVQSTDKIQQIESGSLKHDYVISTGDGLSWENRSLIGVDNENEDEELLKKHTLLVKCLVAFYYSFLASHCDTGQGKPPSFSKHLAFLGAHQYIVQRVIKI